MGGKILRKNDVAIDVLKEWLSYDPDSGILRWNKRRARCVWVGDPAGSLTSFGYLRVSIDGRRYACHRIAWAMTYGCWPQGDLDHINGNRSDNRIVNLRQATRAQNCQNRKRCSLNTSGVKGVSWWTRQKKWRAHIRANGRPHLLGAYSCFGRAIKAYREAARELHGEFARLD